jgi:putative selenium metabolism hydrolase
MINKEYTSLIDLCIKLIKHKSYSGEEEAVVKEAELFWKSKGFDLFQIDRYGNFVASLIGDKPGKKILFDAHIDTVPAEEELWTVSPWSGLVKNGRIYGRGASDMKGALAAMLWGAADFHEMLDGHFSGEIHVAGVVHEECFEGIAARLINESVKPDLVVIGEASELNLKIGQRGRAEIIVETFGKNAHSANPEKGVNAVYSMTKLISEMRLLPLNYQKNLGYGILELTDIKSDPYPGVSVVPDYCRASFDRRLLKGETRDSILEPLHEIINELKSQDPSFKARVSMATAEEHCYTGDTIKGERFFPAWYFNESENFIQTALKGIRSAGLNPELTTYSFCTNGSHYAGEASIPTIGFGPSSEYLAHTVDEYVEIEQLDGACRGYMEIMKSFLLEDNQYENSDTFSAS